MNPVFLLRQDSERSHIRKRILRLVDECPGSGVSELSKSLGVERGTVRYHLLVLERVGLVRSHREHHSFSVFPPSATDQGMRLLAAVRRGRAETIVETVIHTPGIMQKTLGKEVGMSRKVLRRHLDLLTRLGILDERKMARSCRYFEGTVLGRPSGERPRFADDWKKRLLQDRRNEEPQ